MNIPGHGPGEKLLYKKTAAELAEAREVLGLFVAAVEDYAIFALDPEGIILTWNAGGQRLKGYAAEEVVGTSFTQFYSSEDIARRHPQSELKIAAATGKYEEEGWRIRKNGTRFWANVVITALRDAEGKLRGFAKVTRDLTERKNAEEELRRAFGELETRVERRTKELSEEKLRAEQAVATRDQFFSMASHELKTPLTSLKLHTQLRKRKVLKGDLSDFEPHKLVALCENDERQVNRLTYLVDNMLDVTRLTAGAFELTYEPTDYAVLIQNVLTAMAPNLAESRNACQVDCPPSLTGEADQTRIEQVLSNLLSNCAKYARGAPIRIKVRESAGWIILSVKDYGPGIPGPEQGRIFEPFARVENTGASGLGLGLFIVKQIIEAHGGEIFVASAEGEGTEFRIQLPATREYGSTTSAFLP